MRQTVAAIRGTQVPIVVLHESGQRYADASGIVRLRDVEALGLLGNAEVRRPCAGGRPCDGFAERASR
jgi:hypothetical protein